MNQKTSKNLSDQLKILFEDFLNADVKRLDKKEATWSEILELIKNTNIADLKTQTIVTNEHKSKFHYCFHKSFMERGFRLNKKQKDELINIMLLNGKTDYVKDYLLSNQIINYNLNNNANSSGHIIYLIKKAEEIGSDWKSSKIKNSVSYFTQYYQRIPQHPLMALFNFEQELSTEKYLKFIDFFKSKNIGFNTKIDGATPLDYFIIQASNHRNYHAKDTNHINSWFQHLMDMGCRPDKLISGQSAFYKDFPLLLKKWEKTTKETVPSNPILFFGYFIHTKKYKQWLEDEPEKTSFMFLKLIEERRNFDISKFYLLKKEKKEELKIIQERILLHNGLEEKKKSKIKVL